MKTLIAVLLITFSFSSFSFASDFTMMSLSSDLKERSQEATAYMTEMYSASTGVDVEIKTMAGLEQLEQIDSEEAFKVVDDAFKVNSSDSLESFIQNTNALEAISAPVFWLSKCCGCGECTNF